MDLDALLERLQEPRIIGAIVVALIVLWLLKKILSRPQASPHLTQARCASCGWSGQVSKFKPVCPKCAKPIRI